MKKPSRLHHIIVLFLSAIAAGCSDNRIDVYSDIKNPRELGKVLYLERLNGHVISRSNYASPNSEKVFDYLCLASFFAKIQNGSIVKLKIYTSDRSGADESIVYKEADQVEEEGLGPLTVTTIKPIANAKEYIIVIHSSLEDTGLRVLHVDPNIMESITAVHPLAIPDLKSIPYLKDDVDSEKIMALYEGLKKWGK